MHLIAFRPRSATERVDENVRNYTDTFVARDRHSCRRFRLFDYRRSIVNDGWEVELVITLYGLTGVIRIVSYMSQFVAIYRDDHGAQSTSLLTWFGFFAVWLIGVLYGWIVIHDIPVIAVSLCGALGSGLVFAIAVVRRAQFYGVSGRKAIPGLIQHVSSRRRTSVHSTPTGQRAPGPENSLKERLSR